jgi:hypothetical protein
VDLVLVSSRLRRSSGTDDDRLGAAVQVDVPAVGMSPRARGARCSRPCEHATRLRPRTAPDAITGSAGRAGPGSAGTSPTARKAPAWPHRPRMHLVLRLARRARPREPQRRCRARDPRCRRSCHERRQTSVSSSRQYRSLASVRRIECPGTACTPYQAYAPSSRSRRNSARAEFEPARTARRPGEPSCWKGAHDPTVFRRNGCCGVSATPRRRSCPNGDVEMAYLLQPSSGSAKSSSVASRLALACARRVRPTAARRCAQAPVSSLVWSPEPAARVGRVPAASPPSAGGGSRCLGPVSARAPSPETHAMPWHRPGSCGRR